MKITDLLLTDTIKVDLVGTTKDDIISELVDLLDQGGRINHAKKFKKAIMEREGLSSTGVGDGIAIPHAKHKSVVTPSLAFGLSRNGVDFDSMDGKPAHIFFMIAAPEKGNDLHLEALSKLARMLIHESFKEGLLKVKTAEDVLTLINNTEK